MNMISNLHYISQSTPSHEEAIKAACEAGVPMVQLRVKGENFETWLAIAKSCKAICDQFNIPLLINDQIEIARLVKANGVHLGKQDTAPLEARQILGKNAIIGGTANTFEDIQHLTKQGVDYIGLGPFRFTTSKDNLSPILGLEGYRKIIEQCQSANITIPIIAIGGILVDDIEAILATGVHGIAVASLVNEAQDKKKIVELIKEKLQ
jgi:thiamine-phosphate pyrophosphorylase